MKGMKIHRQVPLDPIHEEIKRSFWLGFLFALFLIGALCSTR